MAGLVFLLVCSRHAALHHSLSMLSTAQPWKELTLLWASWRLFFPRLSSTSPKRNAAILHPAGGKLQQCGSGIVFSKRASPAHFLPHRVLQSIIAEPFRTMSNAKCRPITITKANRAKILWLRVWLCHNLFQQALLHLLLFNNALVH